MGTLTSWLRRTLFFALALVTVAACGGNSGGTKTSASSTAVTTTPSESVTDQARVAANSVNGIAPLQQAMSTCMAAVMVNFKDQTQDGAIDTALETLLGHKAKDVYDIAKITSDTADNTINIQYELKSGQVYNAEFDAGRVVFALTGNIPGLELFSDIGDPAIYCTEAAFWYTGQLGGQIGQMLRQKLRPTTTAASIEGNWTLYRQATTCTSNLREGCSVAAMLVRITCASANCTAIRTNNTPGRLGAWTDPLPLVLTGGTWQANGPEAGASSCRGKPAPGTTVTLKLRVTATHVVNGTQKARQLAGSYVVDGAPTTCTKGEPSLGSWTVSTTK